MAPGHIKPSENVTLTILMRHNQMFKTTQAFMGNEGNWQKYL